MTEMTGRPSDRLRPDEDEFRRAVRRIEHQERTVRRVQAVGWIHLALSSLGVLGGLALFGAIAPWGLLSGDPTAAFVTGTVATVLAAVMFTIALPGLFAGIGLLQRRSWGRNVAIVVSALLLFQVPVGTALGAFSLYVLLQDDTRRYFESAEF